MPAASGGQPWGMTNDVIDQATDKVRKLRRSRDDRMVAGVCGGVAELLGVDAALLRILLVAATLFGFGTGALLYLAGWVLVPEKD